jgi:Mitochondrial biogenesis AIM24
MSDMGERLDQFAEVETGEAFTLQNPRLLKIELSETSILARNGAMVAYQGDVKFVHKGGGVGRLLKKAATGESLRLMEATGSGELFLASQAMLVHVLRLENDSLTVNGANILAFEAGIDWTSPKSKAARRGCWPVGCSTWACAGPGWWRSCPTASRCGSTSPKLRPSQIRRPQSPGPAA